MFFDLVPVLNAFIIVGSVVFLNRTMSKNFKNERQYNRKMLDEISTSLLKIITIEKLFVERQKALDDKMNALSEFVDAHSTNAIFQQEQFNTLIKSDMLAARREELRRLKELKVALERLMGVAMTSRQPASPNDVLALENINKRIEELESLV